MESLAPEVLDRLRTYNTPTIANAIEVFDVRPRHEGFMRPEIRCVFPRLGVMVGYAVSLKIQSIIPLQIAARIPEGVKVVDTMERQLINYSQSPGFTVEGLTELFDKLRS